MRNRLPLRAVLPPLPLAITLLLLIHQHMGDAVSAQEAKAKPVPTALPSAVRALSVTRIEWSSDDVVNVHTRNDSGRPILGFVIAHDEMEQERPAHDVGYTVITYLRRFEPNPLQPGLEEVVSQATNEPIRLAAVLYEDGTVEGDRRPCQSLLQSKKEFETELTDTVADLQKIKAWAKTSQELEKTLSRYIKLQLSGLHEIVIGGPPVSFPPSPPGLHPDAALMLEKLIRENSPEVAVDEFIRLAEKRLGQAQVGR